MRDEEQTELDSLTLEEIQAGADDGPVSLGEASPAGDTPYESLPYDPTKDRESMRGKIALTLSGTLAGVVLLSFLFLGVHPDLSKDLRDVLAVLYGPLVALVGAATGYYFGAEANKHR